ncbi:XdhC/CoxI family protein [Rhodococcus sp. IEGM 1318]|uniref:XdhC family protein n=1 Tax=Rhodococcus sp. IEGM 1318 TaxID=3082226 RepID=UPI0029541632|nr:XdhC/CoxI family protein [Rhodococcus sp. IEGM 1318]MDV8009227.1 XdhC/CoxI family protein [Rhodococcus sp. IEGM 1318]
MHNVVDDVALLVDAGATFGLATVVSTFASAPRSPGSSMIVTGDGRVMGSVSGGCVDGAVFTACQYAQETGESTLEHFGVDDDTAFSVGLSCGGTIDVFVQPISVSNSAAMISLITSLRVDVPAVIATVVQHIDAGMLGKHVVLSAEAVLHCDSAPLEELVAVDARRALASGQTSVFTYPDQKVLIAPHTQAPRMLVFGANDFAGAVVKQGKQLGYRVSLIDARPAFTTASRFPAAHDVVVEWPHRYLEREISAGRIDSRTVVCVFTHDLKFDVPLLSTALRYHSILYVGAMGSRRTHEDRNRRLRESGVNESDIARLHSPIGLDLGARTPEEVAVSIAAEIIATRYKGSGAPLSAVDTPIHQDVSSSVASLCAL